MKRKIRERSAGCKSSGAPTDRIEHNGTARSKRRANGLAAIGLAGIMAAGMSLTGCGKYVPGSDMKARIQSEGGEAFWSQESPAAGEASGALGEGGADEGGTAESGKGEGSKAETIKLDTCLLYTSPSPRDTR